jgi:glycerol-3-phosphate dehydrogenase
MTMKRDFGKLGDGPFDLLVIGGGIYGAWIAYDATLRGMKVAIVEKSDWAAGTSSASSKLIHGGLRYLEHFRFGLVRKALSERRLLHRRGRHRVQPLRFVLPIYSDSRVGRLRMRAGLSIYDRLAGKHDRFDRHHSLNAAQLLQRYSFLNPRGLKGGLTYSDGLTDDARLTLEVVAGAMREGAVAVNRARATELHVDGDTVVGARVKDLESGETIEISAAVTANCSGPWCSQLVEAVKPSAAPSLRLSKGSHLVLPPLPCDDAFLLISKRHGGVVFMIPWYGRTLLGTTDIEFDGDPDRVRVEQASVAYLLAQANDVLKDFPWSEPDIISSFAGIRTLPAATGRSSEVTRDLVIEEPLRNLLLRAGGKLTSARVDAARVVDLVLERMSVRSVTSATGDRPLPWAPAGSYRAWMHETLIEGMELGLDELMVNNCQRRYGANIKRLFEIINDAPSLSGKIVPDLPFCLAEIVHAAKHEMARSLEDLLRRRIPLLLLSKLSRETLELAAGLMGPALGWSEQRRKREVAALVQRVGL